MFNRTFQRFPLLLAAFPLAALAANSPVHADVAETLAAASNGASVSIHISARPQEERDDLTITSPVQVGITVIKRYDLEQYIVLDTAMKAYTVTPLSAAPVDLSGIPNVTDLFQPFTASTPPHTRTESIALTVVDEGVSAAPEMPGVSGRHYSIGVATTSDTNSVAGAQPSPPRRIHTDLWVDPRYTRPVSSLANAPQHTVIQPGGDKVVYTISGDLAAYNQAMSYMPLELFGNGPGQGAALKQDGAISASLVAPALFDIPAGYKKMTLEEFATAEQNALLDLISGPQPKLPNTQAAPSAPAAPTPGPAAGAK